MKYSTSQLHNLQRQIWRWNEDFLGFVLKNQRYISEYLALPCKRSKRPSSRLSRCSTVRSKTSHLFWGGKAREDLPDGRDRARRVLNQLGESQLARAQRYLDESLAFQHLLPDGGLAELEQLDKSANVHEIYHNLRKEIRSFLDLLGLFGPIMLANDVIPSDVETAEDVNPRDLEGANRALATFIQTRKQLGHMNDNFAALEKYFRFGEYPDEQARLSGIIETQWAEFKEWVGEVDLAGENEYLRIQLAPTQP